MHIAVYGICTIVYAGTNTFLISKLGGLKHRTALEAHYFTPGLLAVKMIREQIRITKRLAHPPAPTSGGNDELKYQEGHVLVLNSLRIVSRLNVTPVHLLF